MLVAGGVGAQSVSNPNQGQSFSTALTDQSGAPIAHGLQLAYGADAGIGEADNINLTPTNKVSQTIALVDLDFETKERSERLDADAHGAFSYLDFLQGAYGSKLLGRFDGKADLALIQDRLIWRFDDDFGQAQLDPFAAYHPGESRKRQCFQYGTAVGTEIWADVVLERRCALLADRLPNQPFRQ